MSSTVFFISGPYPALTNLHVGHFAKADVVRAQRTRMTWSLLTLPFVVRGELQDVAARRERIFVLFERIGSRRLDEPDNLTSAFKPSRDAIAEWLHVNDGVNGPIEWKYSQRSPTGGELAGVMVQLAWGEQ